jgi:NADPH2:quinone reductase
MRLVAQTILQVEDITLPVLSADEVHLQHHAIGINFADTYFRNGTYPIPLPSGIGVEGAGIVVAIGKNVKNVAVGDRVTYTGFNNTLGAYSSERIVPANALIKLPYDIDFEVAAAATIRGLTSAYLLRRLYDFKSGDTILLHAAAGGVGLIVSQWAKLLGLTVIGTVSSAKKAELAKHFGCDYTIDYSQEPIAEQVRELTKGKGVDVVLDGVGKDTFTASLDSLKPRGLMVCLGTASGLIPPFDPQILAKKGSLFLTRPALADYIADPVEQQQLVSEFFGHVAAHRIQIRN